MQHFLAGSVTWSDFIVVAICVSVIYTLLATLRRRLDQGLYLKEADGPVRAFLRIFLLLIDPLALLVLLAVFVAIYPFVHGMIAALIIAFGWRHIHNYIAGRVLRFDQSIRQGRQVSTGKHVGTVANFGLTALYLQREDGRARLGYSEVLRDGYNVSGDPTRGGFFRLQVVLPKGQVVTNVTGVQPESTDALSYVLLDNPYVRPGFQVETPRARGDDFIVDVNVGLYRTEHLHHLVAQLGELDFQASVISR